MAGLIGVLLLVALIVGVVFAVVGRDRYAGKNPTGFSMATHEVHVDPVTGHRQRVYVDPVSGTRSYIDEPIPIAGGAMPPLQRPGLLHPPGGAGGPPLLPPGAGPPAA